MFALERQQRILELLAENGAVWVSKLSEELGVTEETVRRDLEKLEKQEALRRTHGGALPIEESSNELSLQKRKHTNVEVKERLAEAAVEYIASGDTIFLDASTTTFCMARALRKMKQITQVTVITNSIRVVDELVDCDSVKLIAVGGIASRNRSFVGTLAESSIREHYFANKIFFSGKGITPEAGVLDSNEQECAIKQRMIENAKERFFMCDSTKIGRVGFVKLASLDEIDHFMTEAELPEEWNEVLRAHKIDVIRVAVPR